MFSQYEMTTYQHSVTCKEAYYRRNRHGPLDIISSGNVVLNLDQPKKLL